MLQQYVQQKLKEESSLVASVLSQNGHIYVCGDAIMAADVRSTVHDIVKTNNSQINLEMLIVSKYLLFVCTKTIVIVKCIINMNYLKRKIKDFISLDIKGRTKLTKQSLLAITFQPINFKVIKFKPK